MNGTNISIINLNGNEPLNLDFNKFLKSSNPDETVHEYSTSNDLPLIQEVNSILFRY